MRQKRKWRSSWPKKRKSSSARSKNNKKSSKRKKRHLKKSKDLKSRITQMNNTSYNSFRKSTGSYKKLYRELQRSMLFVANSVKTISSTNQKLSLKSNRMGGKYLESSSEYMLIKMLRMYTVNWHSAFSQILFMKKSKSCTRTNLMKIMRAKWTFQI